MSQNLCGIALPFAVLGIAALHCRDLPGRDEVLEFLNTSDDLCRNVFAESLVLQREEDILKHDFSGIDRCNLEPSHPSRRSYDNHALGLEVGSGRPCLALVHPVGQQRRRRARTHRRRIVSVDGKLNDIADIHVSELRGYATGCYACYFIHNYIVWFELFHRDDPISSSCHTGGFKFRQYRLIAVLKRSRESSTAIEPLI